MAPWWWFLCEPKHVGATVGILIALIFLWFYNCVHHCGTIKSDLILLMHGTNMKISSYLFITAAYPWIYNKFDALCFCRVLQHAYRETEIYRNYTWFQVYAMMCMKSSLFRDVTRCRLVAGYRRCIQLRV
jgi:hypothetical protein